MPKKNRKPIQLTDRQLRFCELIAENEQRHRTEQVARGVLYLQAGYNSKYPDCGAAQEVKKRHIRNEIASILESKYGIKPEPEDTTSEMEEAEKNLKAFSKVSSQGANNYATYLLKKKEAGIIEKTVRKVLLSSFMPESELDYMEACVPQDVVVGGTNKRLDRQRHAEMPVNIGEADES